MNGAIKRSFGQRLWDRADKALVFLSGEQLLGDRPNGGTAILIRSAWITGIVYTLVVLLKAFLQTGLGWPVNVPVLVRTVDETIPWAGGIFAAAYAALYTRFSSQWTYLAGVYHQFMST